jgi:putative flippase GtrA
VHALIGKARRKWSSGMAGARSAAKSSVAGVLGASAPAHIRHYGGFVLGGVLAFTTDAVILEALMRGAGLSPYLARPVGIAAAMVVSWMVNRTVTFAVPTRPTVAEFLQFVAVACSAQVINYSVFALTLLLVGTSPIIAMVVSSFVAMFFSYGGFRYAVFAKRTSVDKGVAPTRPDAKY